MSWGSLLNTLFLSSSKSSSYTTSSLPVSIFIFTSYSAGSCKLSLMLWGRKKEYIRGFTTNIDYLENIASYHRNHDVDVVDEEEGLIDNSVGDVGQVVCQVEHHGQRVAGGVVELLQEVHQDGTPLRLGAGEEENKIDLSFLAKYDKPAETRVKEAIESSRQFTLLLPEPT